MSGTFDLMNSPDISQERNQPELYFERVRFEPQNTMIKLRTKDGSYSAPVLTALFVIFFLILAAHSLVIAGAYILLCLWTLLGPRQAIQALSLNYIIIFLNPGIFHPPGAMGILRWLILFLAGLRVLPAASSSAWRYILPLVLFLAVVTALAGITSNQFMVSFLKVTIFSYTAATVLAAYDSIGEPDRENLKVWFLSLTAAVVVLSLPTLVLGAAYLGAGFRGIFTHCQLFGTFLAPPASYLFARLLLRKGPHSPWLWVLGALYTAMIVLSRARTGMLALLLGLVATMVFGIFTSRREIMQLVPAGTLLKVGASIAFIIILVSASSVFSKRVEGFWLKGDEGKSVEQAFYSSRGAGMAWQWKHFIQQPLTGHGFGVDVGHFNPKNTVTFMGIPIASPVEKGFLPVAVLEEIGLVGLAAFIPFFVILILGALGQRDIGLIAMCLSCLLINMGEAVFFSPGFLGGYLWLLIGLSTAAGRQPKVEHET
jgi:hypothetical protein